MGAARHRKPRRLLSATLFFFVPLRRCGVPFNRLLRRRSAWVVGTCCTRPWCLGAYVRSERLATVPSWTVCLSCSPTTLSCRDLLHSALASGRLCQVRTARHCSFLVSVLELLTDDPTSLPSHPTSVVMVCWFVLLPHLSCFAQDAQGSGRVAKDLCDPSRIDSAPGFQ